MRTDDHNNPIAFTTDVAKQAGLAEWYDYTKGRMFISFGGIFYTAEVKRDPISVCIRVIDKLSFRTTKGTPRWSHTIMPKFIWDVMSTDQKRDIIGFMYEREGGTLMRRLFPNYGTK